MLGEKKKKRRIKKRGNGFNPCINSLCFPTLVRFPVLYFDNKPFINLIIFFQKLTINQSCLV